MKMKVMFLSMSSLTARRNYNVTSASDVHEVDISRTSCDTLDTVNDIDEEDDDKVDHQTHSYSLNAFKCPNLKRCKSYFHLSKSSPELCLSSTSNVSLEYYRSVDWTLSNESINNNDSQTVQLHSPIGSQFEVNENNGAKRKEISELVGPHENSRNKVNFNFEKISKSIISTSMSSAASSSSTSTSSCKILVELEEEEEFDFEEDDYGCCPSMESISLSSEDVLQLTRDLIRKERQFQSLWLPGCELYGSWLRLSSSSAEDEEDAQSDRNGHQWTDSILSMSKSLEIGLEDGLQDLDSFGQKIVNCFSSDFWHQLEETVENVQKTKESILRIVKDKSWTINLTRKKRIHNTSPPGEHRLNDILRFIHLPLERLTHYERYLGQLASKTDPNHPHFAHLSSSSKRAKQLLNMSPYLPPNEPTKKLKKSRKSINWPFKKSSLSKSESSSNTYGGGGGGGDTVDSGSPAGKSPDSWRTLASFGSSKIFGQPLVNYLNGDTILPPISNMLMQLYLKGPFTVGIFRKSANARVCRELKAKLEEDSNADLDDFPVIVIASVFKEFLRSLPDCILDSKLYHTWIQTVNTANNLECRDGIGQLLNQLPNENLVVLRHLLCVLWHIAQHSTENKMCSMNLAVCIGPSLLYNKETLSVSNCEEISKQVPKLVSYLIDHCPQLLGDNTLRLFENQSTSAAEKDSKAQQDSGAEESDSLKSLHEVGFNLNSGHHNSNNVHNRRDDSSLDSIEKAVLDEETSVVRLPLQALKQQDSNEFGNKMSLSNLSRDSGLTLSDTQLYSPGEDNDEEEEEEEEEEDEEVEEEVDIEESGDSSDGSDGFLRSRLLPHLTKSSPHLNTAGLESAINVTFSYGRSVGVSIDGSCHDVVRKRRHQDPSGRHHKHNPYSCMIGYIRNQQQVQETLGNNRQQSNRNPHQSPLHPPLRPSSYNDNNNNKNSNHHHKQEQQPPYHSHQQYHQHQNHHHHQYSHHNHLSRQPAQQQHHQHLPLHLSKSYSSGINHPDLADNSMRQPDQLIENENGPKSVSRYRHRRPPLSAILTTSKNFSTSGSNNGDSNLRKSTSEESVPHCNSYESESVPSEQLISLPYHVNRSPMTIDVDMDRQVSQSKLSPFMFSKTTSISQTDLKGEHVCDSKPTPSSFKAIRGSPENSTNVQIVAKNSSFNGSIGSNSGLRPDNRSNNSCSSSETASQRSCGSKRSANMSSPSSATSSSSASSANTTTSTRSNPLSVSPPSYQETMNRKEILARIQNLPVASRRISSTSPVSSGQLFEESVRVYNEDLQKGSNVLIRAVPVRIKEAGSVNNAEVHSTTANKQSNGSSLNLSNGSNNNNNGCISLRKPPLCRISSERQMPTAVNITQAKRPLRFCNSVKIKDSHDYKHNTVSIEERCAKDFTDDWRKEIHWSVAQLRALFNEEQQLHQEQQRHQETTSKTLETKPVSVLVTSPSSPSKPKSPSGATTTTTTITTSSTSLQSSSSPLEDQPRFTSTSGCQAFNKENCVTVIHVSQGSGVANGVLGANKKRPTVVSVHKRSDSLMSSSGEESYV